MLTRKPADAELMWCNSFERAPKLIDLAARMQRTDWLHLLGESWSMMDNVGLYRDEFRRLLPGTGPVVELMDDAETAAWHALPDEVTIFRGCGAANQEGCCWSTDVDVARAFPFTNRYRQAEPMLITAKIARHQALAVKLDRGELEVITFSARPVFVQALEAAR